MTEPKHRWPLGLIGMISLIVGVERFVARNDLCFSSPEAWDWRLGRQTASAPLARDQVLCFGDSQVKYGVQPLVLQAGLGRSVRNLALCGGAPPASYFLLRRALSAGTKPGLIVVDFHRDILAKSPRAQAAPAQWSELLSPREALDLSVDSQDPGFLAEWWLARLVPSFRHRQNLRDGIETALRGRPSRAPMLNSMLVRNWRRNAGAQASPESFVPVDVELKPDTPDPAGYWHQANPSHARYTEAFLTLADSQDIPVVWLLPPVMTGLQTALDRGAGEARFLRFVRETQARHPRLVVVDARHSGFGNPDFCNVVHLNRRGATTLSANLAPVIGRLLAGDSSPSSRWVNLPHDRQARALPLLEDVFESAQAVGLSMDRLRR